MFSAASDCIVFANGFPVMAKKDVGASTMGAYGARKHLGANELGV
jgi:hypothetical protein